MLELIKKYKEIITYIFFGVLSTVVSWGTYILFEQKFALSVFVSNLLSWICAVAFAFVTNKLWVFESKSMSPRVLLKELTTFITSRVITGLIEIAGVPLLAKTGLDNLFFNLMYKLNLDKFEFLFTDGIYSKIIISVIVVILNYVFSKLFVFRNKQEDK